MDQLNKEVEEYLLGLDCKEIAKSATVAVRALLEECVRAEKKGVNLDIIDDVVKQAMTTYTVSIMLGTSIATVKYLAEKDPRTHILRETAVLALRHDKELDRLHLMAINFFELTGAFKDAAGNP